MDSEAENDGGVAVADAPAPVVEVTPEPVVTAEPAPAPAPKPRVADPLINTITGLRSKNRENETRIERLERENAEYRAITERLAKGDKVDPAPTPQPPRPESSPPPQVCVCGMAFPSALKVPEPRHPAARLAVDAADAPKLRRKYSFRVFLWIFPH